MSGDPLRCNLGVIARGKYVALLRFLMYSVFSFGVIEWPNPYLLAQLAYI